MLAGNTGYAVAKRRRTKRRRRRRRKEEEEGGGLCLKGGAGKGEKGFQVK